MLIDPPGKVDRLMKSTPGFTDTGSVPLRSLPSDNVKCTALEHTLGRLMPGLPINPLGLGIVCRSQYLLIQGWAARLPAIGAGVLRAGKLTLRITTDVGKFSSVPMDDPSVCVNHISFS